MPCWVDQVKLAAQEMHVREHECTINIYNVILESCSCSDVDIYFFHYNFLKPVRVHVRVKNDF